MEYKILLVDDDTDLSFIISETLTKYGYIVKCAYSEEMAYELVANGFLGCLHQILTGAPKRVSVTYVFANPDLSAGCQVRSMFRNGKLNLSTIMEQQKIKMDKGMPLF